MPDRPVAVVTGAARGIGHETARRLAATHRVALLDLDGAAAERNAAAIARDALWARCDITDAAGVEAAVEHVVATAGAIDVVVSNAGVATFGALRHLDPQVLAAQLEVNLTGNWRFVRACLPHVLARRGYVLGVASAAALVPAPGLGAYGASKAGLEMLLETLRVEVAHLGTDVGIAYFGWVDTEMVRGGERQHSGFAKLRGDMTGPASRVIPVGAAADAIVRGVERRSHRVYAPRYIGPLRRLRGLVGPLVERDALRAAAQVDRITQDLVAERGTFAGGLRADGDAPSQAAARAVGRETAG
jgi:NAD(P)-dependent dehydrogenase (short-subunit alcohol dehydrogenase family)